MPENSIPVLEPRRKGAENCSCALFRLGETYRNGQGTKKDELAAYMWFLLAELTSKHRCHMSRKARVRLANKLQPPDIAEAERRAAKWLKVRPFDSSEKFSSGKSKSGVPAQEPFPPRRRASA